VITSIERFFRIKIWAPILLLATSVAFGQAVPVEAPTPFHSTSTHLPLDIGVLVQGGFGLTENRNGFKFLLAGVHAGKVLTGNYGPGILHGNFEYAVEVFPFWQSYTPKFQRETCVPIVPLPDGGSPIECSAPYTVGGTFTGVSITPIILRWNFAGTRHFSPWVQGAGGVLWTNHKYPAFGGPPYNPINDGLNADASVWNFTPQGGVGVHYFIHPRRSIDFSANGVHISSASLGDRNPGVNASIQFSLGYSWWK
jgi:lipid A 3-O-deacylase